jgi:5-methylcytosine-specific restriction protein A
MPVKPRRHDPHKRAAASKTHVAPESKRKGSTEQGYNYKWQKARLRFLFNNPLCVDCEERGIVTPATEVDHKEPHKGNKVLFWRESNWQGLCKSCHSRKTMNEIKRKQRRGGV